MATRAFERPPRFLSLYARTLAPLVPGAPLLPWVGGAGGPIPELELTLAGARGDTGQLARYASVCGFDPADEDLPATFPHVLAFPLHLALMSDGRFPFAAVGLVHVANRIEQQRAIRAHERLDLRVYATPVRPHARGRVFSLVTEARTAGELVWRERSTMLRRGSGGAKPAANGQAPTTDDRAGAGAGATGAQERRSEWLSAPASQEWRLAGDQGRRYAAVSGDRNPIHMHPLSARALGFPRAIAHGMWTKARSLAALQATAAVPRGPFAVEVSFRRPILLPASVLFASAADAQTVSFGVRDARTHRGTGEGTEHLDGRIGPLEDITRALEEEL
jgi:acyl dehydratase